MQKMKATLILENGMTFAGRSIGSGEERICEMARQQLPLRGRAGFLFEAISYHRH